jgi:hypothetical protein
MQGVNLGGWLVIEEFLAPDMYANATTQKPYHSPRIPNGVNIQECVAFPREKEGRRPSHLCGAVSTGLLRAF